MIPSDISTVSMNSSQIFIKPFLYHGPLHSFESAAWRTTSSYNFSRAIANYKAKHQTLDFLELVPSCLYELYSLVFLRVLDRRWSPANSLRCNTSTLLRNHELESLPWFVSEGKPTFGMKTALKRYKHLGLMF